VKKSERPEVGKSESEKKIEVAKSRKLKAESKIEISRNVFKAERQQL
jgi:hypothetical protein